ncbi:MAG: phosphoribosylglycinamide formyltransferase-1 [Pirellulaceae bacterium]|jgi:phosphoribosylglycinamide formyltransferase-1
MPDSSPAKPLRIAVLISGGGTTLRNILDRVDAGQLDVEVGLVISSSDSAGGLQYARDANIPYVVVKRDESPTAADFSAAVFGPIRAANVQVAVMGGFLKHVLIPGDFENRVLNIHPSLVPAFSGKGFYGLRVHSAVLDYGAKVSGCTVHFVDNEYDHGPIILQKTVPVRTGDTPALLQKRIFEQECEAYPEVLQLYAEGKVTIDGRIVNVLD